MGSTTLYFLLLISVVALHANASQEAQLTKFLLSRRTRTSTSSSTSNPSVHEPGFRVTSSLQRGNTVSDQTALKAADKIAALPGQPEGVDFNQYGGYVTVDEKNGRALFYYFVEAPNDAATKPLLLWLNGGPGCSSLGYGAMQELGPFRVSRDNQTLSRNKHAWNNVANVIFLESPAGVGFSYSNTSSDYKTGDSKTAEDNYIFLINWLERFPEYKTRSVYISGESYAGHYAPQLAATILSHNKHSNGTIINLRGILVGNPYLDRDRNSKGRYEYLWNHGVLSDEVWADITGHCNFNSSDGAACVSTLDGHDLGLADPYNIYSGCYFPGYDPWSDISTEGYLNHPAVQKAFHARKIAWEGCAGFLHWKDAPESMVPTIKWLIEHGLPVWLFSGDFDSICPFTATRYTVRDLNLSVTKQWRPWTAAYETGGYVQQYTGGFAFVSVRGAGHTVPSFQPERALIILDSFLKGILPR